MRSPKSRVLARNGTSWYVLLLIMVIVVALASAGIWWFTRGKTVPTLTVQKGSVVKAFYATGVVRPDYEYIIKSKAQGALIGFEKREGASVKKGELLARIDDRQLRFEAERCAAELAEAKKQADDKAPQRMEISARLNEAKEQLEIATRTMTRMNASFDKGASTLTDVDNARRFQVQWVNTIAALESQLGTWKIESQRRVDVAEANLRKAQANLEDSNVLSPIDGVILERHVENQQVVGINEKLMLIAALDDMLMKAAVDEEDVIRTAIGQLVKLQLYAFQNRDESSRSDAGPTIFEGRVTEILPSANPTNKTFEVKVKFVERPLHLRVGMTGELNFIESASEIRGAIVVPSSAVLDKKVYRPTGAGKYAPVDVVIGTRTLEKVEISKGLAEGDIIVADAKQVAPVKLPPRKAPSVPTRTGDDVVKE